MHHMIRLMVMLMPFANPATEFKWPERCQSPPLWRFPPKRVEAEVIRDSILLASGKLNPSIGGKATRVAINQKKTYAQGKVATIMAPHTRRRLLHQERMRRVDDQIFTAFDFPGLCQSERNAQFPLLLYKLLIC